jgi:hypothetical protein
MIEVNGTAEFNYSSSLRAVHFVDKGDSYGDLYVEFLNGNKAAYSDVPERVFKGFGVAASPGRYYNQYVKGLFNGLHVEDDETFKKAGESVEPTPEPATVAPQGAYKVLFELTTTGELVVDGDDVHAALSGAESTVAYMLGSVPFKLVITSVNPV